MFSARMGENGSSGPVGQALFVGHANHVSGVWYDWVCPAGVFSVSAVAVGAGGYGTANYDEANDIWYTASGAGGGLAWKNNIPVVPGQTYKIYIAGSAANTSDYSLFGPTTALAAAYVAAKTANNYAGGTKYIGDGGGTGGPGGVAVDGNAGGGGAGGYTGNGGAGGVYGAQGATAGAGGGGGGGNFVTSYGTCGGGGGVGVMGQGANGRSGASDIYNGLGGGGSNGTDGHTSSFFYNLTGGNFGGGAGSQGGYSGTPGGLGAVRLIWGEGRSFPSTNTEDKNVPNGQAAFTSPGSFNWLCPADVTSVCVVAIGAGGGGSGAHAPGGGGGLGWRNNIPVVPGQNYAVFVGSSPNYSIGNPSYFIDQSVVMGGGGTTGSGGGFTGTGGGNGGDPHNAYQAGGGAGGYTGTGGGGSPTGFVGAGGGGGGGGYNSGGGGVGLLGQGADGAAGGASNGGKGGSGGTDGTGPSGSNGGFGGVHGGGVGGGIDQLAGGRGAVRIIWGTGRAFPSTLTGDL